MAESKQDMPEDPVQKTKEFWNSFALKYTDGVSDVTLQGARALHSAMKLSGSKRVLEIACGAGVGTRDILSYFQVAKDQATEVIATDISEKMIELAHKNLAEELKDSSKGFNISVNLANALDLKEIASDSVDRYISSLALQLVPDADKMLSEAFRVLEKSAGIAGFVIWGRRENDGQHLLLSKVNQRINETKGLDLPVNDHPNYKFGENMDNVVNRIEKAGFQHVVYWPMYLACPIFNVDEFLKSFVEFRRYMFSEDDNIRELQTQYLREIIEEYLEKQHKPMGMEVYLILAFPRK